MFRRARAMSGRDNPRGDMAKIVLGRETTSEKRMGMARLEVRSKDRAITQLTSNYVRVQLFAAENRRIEDEARQSLVHKLYG